EPLGIKDAMDGAGLFGIMDYSAWKLVFGILVTTVGWVTVTYLTPPEKQEVLARFCSKIRAGGPGWRKVVAAGGVKDDAAGWDVPTGLLCMMVGCLAVWSALFGVGYLLYGKFALGGTLTAVSVGATILLMRLAGKIRLS
ncbi:MAG: hypothetical protein FWE69_08495, partial [Clostridiales bacterium]|nr:hypothetical protein [Clostridiales bacterium]